MQTGQFGLLPDIFADISFRQFQCVRMSHLGQCGKNRALLLRASGEFEGVFEQFRAFLQDEIVKWRKVIQVAGLKAE